MPNKLEFSKQSLEKRAIVAALRASGGDLEKAASVLEMRKPQLLRKLRNYDGRLGVFAQMEELKESK